MSKKENFFGKNYDVPSGMSPTDFERKLDQWKEHEEIQRKGDRGSPLEKEFERVNEAAMLLKTKDLIRGVTLKDGFVSEENQKKLEERKRIALEYLDKLIIQRLERENIRRLCHGICILRTSIRIPERSSLRRQRRCGKICRNRRRKESTSQCVDEPYDGDNSVHSESVLFYVKGST